MREDTAVRLATLARGEFAGARELKLPGLSEFPSDLYGLADTLELLDISDGTLHALPDDLGRFRKLRVLFCSGNRFERLPPALGDCPALSQIGFRNVGMRELPAEALPPNLRWLILTGNEIAILPDALGERPRLQKLMLAGNRIERLPETLAGAAALELVRLSSNRLPALPDWLATLPRLAWVSWSGNPFEARLATPGREIPWNSLRLAEVLGQGASGHVHQAVWSEGGERAVALKVYKGAMTSDGLPDREIAACLAAGEHPNLVSAFGRVVGHPQGSEALVMPLLPRDWRVLAGPPSLTTCSRDVYDPALRLDPAVALRIATGVAEATVHLHARGLLHGDLYGHNTLWDGVGGDAMLSDFGAACVLPEGARADDWRRIEARAWGLLLGELLDCCATPSAQDPALRALADACVQPHVGARPLMAEALQTLRALS